MRPQKSRTGESGFTLLELLVAITVAALLLTLVAPRLAGTVAHARLKATASKVALALRETRWEAMKTSEPMVFAVDPSGLGFSSDNRSSHLPSGQTIGFAPYNQDSAASEAKVEFLPDGSSSGGRFVVADGQDKILIDVDWLTGRVTTND